MQKLSYMLLAAALASTQVQAGDTQAAIGGAVGGALGSVVGQQVGGSTGSTVGAGVGGAIGGAMGADSHNRTEAAIGGGVGAAAGNVIGQQVGGSTGGVIGGALGGGAGAALGNGMDDGGRRDQPVLREASAPVYRERVYTQPVYQKGPPAHAPAWGKRAKDAGFHPGNGNKKGRY